MTALLTFFTADAFWLQVLRFALGSTLILGTVKLLTEFGVVRQLRLQSLLWKSGVLASLLLLLPLSSSLTPTLSLPQAGNSPVMTGMVRNAESQIARGFPAGPATTVVRGPQVSEVPTGGFGFNPVVLVLLLWGTISTVLIVRQLRERRRSLEKLGPRENVDPFSELRNELVQQCRRQNIHPLPRLTVSENLTSPVALTNNEICLPRRLLNTLLDEEIACVLAHELGHIKNRDIQLMAVMQVLVGLFFFQPLFRTAQRELMDLAEFIADQDALTDQHDSGQLANALVNCAHHVNRDSKVIYGIAMVSEPSRLRARIEQLLGDGPFTTWQVKSPLQVLLAATVVGSAFLLPVFAQETQTTNEAAPEVIDYEPVACNAAGYEVIVDHVHGAIVTAQAGLARWEQSCGTDSGAQIDATWTDYDLPAHHLEYMANMENPETAGKHPQLTLLYRALIAGQAFSRRSQTTADDQAHDHESAH